MESAFRNELSRTLLDPNTGKVWRGILQGKDVQIEAGNPEKLRRSTKSFDTKRTAHEYLTKQQWSKLKSGYVLRNPDAASGEPSLHAYVGGGNTGMLALAASDDRIFCCRFEDSNNILLTLDESGNLDQHVEVPDGRLVFDMIYSRDLGRVLLNADHGILSCDPAELNGFETVSEMVQHPASCLSAGGTRVAVFEHPYVVVKDAFNGESIFELECTPELVGGHSHQMCTALNREGDLLAVCSQAGEVGLFDLKSRKQIAEIKGGFEAIEKLEFDATGELLIGLGQYGPWGPLFFDIKTQKLVDSPFALPALVDGSVYFTIDTEKPRLALASADEIHIFDTQSYLHTQTIKLEHVVKRVQACFFGEKIAVRTDYGCLSLYALHSVQENA